MDDADATNTDSVSGILMTVERTLRASARGGRVPPVIAHQIEGRLSDVAYHRFLEALFLRKLQPGTFVSQGELAETLNVPIAPLRDALRILQTEGWLTIHARSGIELRRPDLELVRNSIQLRIVLEKAAIRTFAGFATTREIEELRSEHQAVHEAMEGRELDPRLARQMEALDAGFHRRIIGIQNNPLITECHERAQRFLALVRLDRGFRASSTLVRRTMTEHLAILDACKRRDSDAAEAALDAHLTRAMQRSMGVF